MTDEKNITPQPSGDGREVISWYVPPERGHEVEAAYFNRRCLMKKHFVICDNDSYEPAVALCQYYKKTGNTERLREIGAMLLAANDEVGEKEGSDA